MKNEMTQQETYSVIKTMEELSKNAHRLESAGNKVVPADDIDKALNILRRVASGELAEVVHAHWFEDTEPADGDIRCSNCGIAWPICVQKYLQHVGVKKWTNFLKICPDCGALMDGKDDSYETN